MSKFISSEKADAYFTTTTRFGFLFQFLYQFVLIVISYANYRYMYKNCDINDAYFSKLVFYSTLFLSAAAPLTMLNTQVGSRFFTFTLIPIFFEICMIIQNAKKQSERSKIRIFLFRNCTISYRAYCCVFLSIILAYSIAVQVPSVISDVFTYNFFL